MINFYLIKILGNLTLGDIQATNRLLLHSGAAIEEVNTVRKHTDALKGGKLAKLAVNSGIRSNLPPLLPVIPLLTKGLH